MCLLCLIIIQSCHFNFRINKPFACSCYVICISCSSSVFLDVPRAQIMGFFKNLPTNHEAAHVTTWRNAIFKQMSSDCRRTYSRLRAVPPFPSSDILRVENGRMGPTLSALVSALGFRARYFTGGKRRDKSQSKKNAASQRLRSVFYLLVVSGQKCIEVIRWLGQRWSTCRRSFVVKLRYVTDTGGNLCKQKLWLILEQYEESNLSLRAVLVWNTSLGFAAFGECLAIQLAFDYHVEVDKTVEHCPLSSKGKTN